MDTWIWTEPAATARRGRGREGIWWRWCVSDRAVGRIWSLALEKPGGGGTLVDGTGVAGRKSLRLARVGSHPSEFRPTYRWAMWSE